MISIMNFSRGKKLEDIWHQVPQDYYQKGIEKNLLQRIWHRGKFNAIISLIDKEPNNILDVGCASGWFLYKIASRYPKAKCTGIDIYKKAIDYGKKRYKSLNLIYADAHNVPFPDNSFNAVICTEVLEHVVDPGKIIREIKRVLKPEGIAIIEMDTGNILFRIVWYWWTHLRNGVWKDSHIHVFNTNKLESLIIKNGFIITKKKLFNFSMAVSFQLKKNKDKTT